MNIYTNQQIAKPAKFKIKYRFFRRDKTNIQHEKIKKIITIHKPLIDGPNNMDLPINDPNTLENHREKL